VINFVKDKMDHEEVEEGTTWRDLSHVVMEATRKLGLEEGQYRTGEGLNPSHQDEKTAWPILLLLLFRERSFFGLTKDRGGGVSIMRIKSSKRVLDAFFEQAWSKPIVRSRTG
jgi:hypothetical protein